MPWYIWVAIAVAAGIGEAFTLSLVLASVAVAAGIVALLSTAISPVAQVVAFGLLVILLIVAVRPAVLRILPRQDPGDATPRIGPVGSLGVAVEQIDRRRGQIRVGRAEFFSARVLDPDAVIPADREVEIVRMDGLTALVRPLPAAGPPVLEAEGAAPFGLSSREIEVLQLVAAGLSNAEIAERLVLSPRTVHHHVSHILNKMGVDSRVDAVRLAFERGIVRPGQNDRLP